MPDSNYIQGQTETGPKPGGGQLTQPLNPFQYITRAAANLLASIFGGTVTGGGSASNVGPVHGPTGPINLPDAPLNITVGGTEYQGGTLQRIVDAYGASKAAQLINSGFFGEKPATDLHVHAQGQDILTAPIARTPILRPGGSGGLPPRQTVQPIQHVESVKHPDVQVLPQTHYAPQTDITGKIIG